MSNAAQNKQIAETILAQLGGRRFMVMTGAKNFVAVDNGLRFRIPNATSRKGQSVNLMEIILMPSDTYRVRTYYVRGTNVRMVEESDDIYCDVLQDVFTRLTGLYTRL